MHKPIKQEFGGGYKIFIFDELDFYEGKVKIALERVASFSLIGVENEKEFFTCQERQSIVRHLLFSIKIAHHQDINGVKFKVDQSLSKIPRISSLKISFLSL